MSQGWPKDLSFRRTGRTHTVRASVGRLRRLQIEPVTPAFGGHNYTRISKGPNVRVNLSILRKLGGISWLTLGELTR